MKEQELIRKIFARGQVFNFSNSLSFIRLIGAFYLYYLILNRVTWPAFYITLLLILSDFADGYFARKLNQVSEMGKILDPLADKFCFALSSIALYQSYGFPLWVVAVIIGRDILIIIGSLILISRLPYVTPSAMPGKIAVTILSALALSYLLEIKMLQHPLEILTVLAIIVSFVHYGYRFYRQVTRRKHPEGERI